MGDRGVIGVRQDDGNYVYIYTHWGGSDLRTDLQKVLTRRVRWDQRDYLARIIYDEMAKGSYGDETGFGISTNYSLPDWPMLIVGEGEVVEVWSYNKSVKHGEITFEDFIADADIHTTIELMTSQAVYERVLDEVAESGEVDEEKVRNIVWEV